MELSKVIASRRSTRKFTNDPVSAEQINALLEAAIAAPNACNMQSWHFYVVTDPTVKATLAEEKAIAEWATTAPVLFVVCTAANDIVSLFGEIGEKLFAVQDTACAIENILLCAADMGLGGCFMGAFKRDLVERVVGIKQGHNPIAVVPIGKPAAELPARPRNPLEKAVTFVGSPADATAQTKDCAHRGYEVRNCTLPGALFENTCLDGASFKNCSMKNVRFEDCELTVSDK